MIFANKLSYILKLLYDTQARYDLLPSICMDDNATGIIAASFITPSLIVLHNDIR